MISPPVSPHAVMFNCSTNACCAASAPCVVTALSYYDSMTSQAECGKAADDNYCIQILYLLCIALGCAQSLDWMHAADTAWPV